MIYDRLSAQMALGIIMNNPSLLYNGKYKIERRDFDGDIFHKMLFACIENIASTGAKEIDPPSVATFINSSEEYKSARNILENENYMDFIVSYKEVAKNSSETFDFYYNNLRKNTLLREYKKLGYNITEIYDESKNEESQKKKLNDYNVQDIINYFEKIQSKLKNEFSNEIPIEQSYAGENVENLLEMLSTTPLTGACMNSPYITTLSNGWSQGHLILRGADSGAGKTLQAIADTALVCCPKLYDPIVEDFVDNPNYQEGGGLYIHTEQSQFFEIHPRFLSYVSNVDCWKILKNLMNENEKKRVIEAGHILEKGRIHLMNIPHFTLNTLYDNVKNVSLNEGIHTFVFDYIFNNGIAISEYSKLVGLKSIREDQFFLMMVTRLKEIAEEFNLRVMTMSQLNGKQKDPKMKIVDERCLFGATSLKTKLDSGYICTSPKKAELDEIMPLIEGNVFCNAEINNITHCFKARHSQYKSNLKIWQSLNKSTGRMTDILVTDADNEPIKIDKMVLKNIHLIKE